MANSLVWLPNLVHYNMNSVPLPPPAPELPFVSEDFLDNGVLDWPSFGESGFVYTLEYQLVGSDSWQLLYRGENSYFQPAEGLPSGSYQFRINCAGLTGCPAEGYVFTTIDIVQKPAYVNAAFDHNDSTVNVYWEGLEQVVGYALEQSADQGASWQTMAPETETGVDYQGENYSGNIHTSNSVTLSDQAVAQGIQTAKVLHLQRMKTAKLDGVNSKNSINSTYQVGSTLQYRVKACATPKCGDNQHSQTLSIVQLNGVIPDPGFEQGNIQFEDDVGASLAIDSTMPINETKSLAISLKNYGLAQYIHRYDSTSYPILNGVTLSGKLRINSIDKDSKISVYPVAYYEGIDRRIEGQKQEFTYQDIGKDLTIKSEMWLNNDLSNGNNQVKRIHFLVRLIGEGAAEVVIDDAQLYEGSGLAQTDPTLTSYYSNYSGIVKLNWTEFYNAGASYKLEYREQRENDWQQLYFGPETEFENSTPFDKSGVYYFRIACNGVGNCPTNGYVEATTVVAREPAYISVKTNATNNTTRIEWAEVPSAVGYLIQKSTSGGAWQNVPPTASDPSRSYTAMDDVYRVVYTSASTTLNSIVPSTERYRVIACRWAGCNGRYQTSTNVYLHDSDPLAVNNFSVNKPSIKPGESIFLYWDRPENYSSEFTYNIYVTKPSDDGYPEVPKFKWQSDITIHGISRGGLEGIQRTGTHTIEIEACRYGVCSAQQQLEIVVEGPPPSPSTFTADKAFINPVETVTLSWAMNPNYKQQVKYNLSVNKPNGDYTTFARLTESESFNRLINMAGVHTFYIQPCEVGGDCQPQEELKSLQVYVGVLQDSQGNLYLAHNNKLLKLTLVNEKWQVVELTPAELEILSENLVASDYTVEFGHFSADSIEDFRLTNTTTQDVITFVSHQGNYQSSTGAIILLNIDLLGVSAKHGDH